MRQRTYGGFLTFATSRPGSRILCVQEHSKQFLSLWTGFNTGRVLPHLPLVGSKYIVRGNTHGPDDFPERFRLGVLLSEENGKPMKNPTIHPQAKLEYEPYFLFECFSLIPASAPVPPRMIVRQTGRR